MGKRNLTLRFAGNLPDGKQFAVKCPECGLLIMIGTEQDLRAKDGSSVITCGCGFQLDLEVRQTP